jgi:hypothetical protein
MRLRVHLFGTSYECIFFACIPSGVSSNPSSFAIIRLLTVLLFVMMRAIEPNPQRS